MKDSESNTYKIPYQFCPIPYEFLKPEFTEDAPMFRLILFIFKRIRFSTHIIKIKSNGYHDVKLEPLEFIFGRKACAIETELTEKQVRNRIERLIALGYISDQRASSWASSSASSFPQKRASSFSIYTICTEAFSKKEGQQFSSKKGQQLGQQLGHKQEEQEEQEECLFKKETRKKENVHNFSEDLVTPQPPKGGVVVPLSFSLDEKNKEQISQDDLDAIEGKLMTEPISIVAPSFITLKRWINKFTLDRLIYSIQMLEREIVKKSKINEIIDNKEGWIQRCLDLKWDLKEIYVNKNKIFLENFRETHKIMTIKFFQKSANDFYRKFEFEFTLHPEQFEEYVKSKYGYGGY